MDPSTDVISLPGATDPIPTDYSSILSDPTMMDPIGLPGAGQYLTTGGDPVQQLAQSNPGMFQQLAQALGISAQSLLMGGIGALGPLAGLVGALASGGRGPTTSQSGTSAQSGNFLNTGNTVTSQTGQQTGTQMGSQLGSQIGATMPQLLGPAAQAGGYAQGALQAMSPFAQALYGQGAGVLGNVPTMLGMNPQVASAISALQSGGGPATGNFMNVSMTPTPAMEKLVKQAYEPYVGSITQQAIESARNRGFAGGADLLGGAAAPLAGQALANLPGLEANSLLQAMTQFPLAQAQVGSAESAAGTNAYNALTQALLGSGQLANTAQGQTLNALPSLIQAMMNPLTGLASQETQLLGTYPAGSASQQQTAGQTTGQTIGQQTQTGATTSQQQGQSAQSNQFGTTGTSQIPMGNLIGQGIGSILGGFGQGAATQGSAEASRAFQQALANLIGGGQRTSLSQAPGT